MRNGLHQSHLGLVISWTACVDGSIQHHELCVLRLRRVRCCCSRQSITTWFMWGASENPSTAGQAIRHATSGRQNVRPTSLCKVGNFVGYTLPITAACAVLFRVQLLGLLRLAECGQYGGGFREQKQAVGYADSASRVGFAAIRYFLEEVFEFMLYLPSTSASGEVVYKGGTNKSTAHHGLSLLQSLQRAQREVMGACNFESIPACLTECVTYFWAVWPVCSIGWIEISANKQRC
jgi:hypothetical protein